MKKLLFIIALFIGISAQAQLVNNAGNIYVISEVNSSQVTLNVFESLETYQAYSDSTIEPELGQEFERISIYIPNNAIREAESKITSLDGLTLLEKRNEIIYELLIENSKENFQNWQRTRFETSDLIYKKL